MRIDCTLLELRYPSYFCDRKSFGQSRGRSLIHDPRYSTLYLQNIQVLKHDEGNGVPRHKRNIMGREYMGSWRMNVALMQRQRVILL